MPTVLAETETQYLVRTRYCISHYNQHGVNYPVIYLHEGIVSEEDAKAAFVNLQEVFKDPNDTMTLYGPGLRWIDVVK